LSRNPNPNRESKSIHSGKELRTGYQDGESRGAGEGFNINVPLPRGADDAVILNAFKTRLIPVKEAQNSLKKNKV